MKSSKLILLQQCELIVFSLVGQPDKIIHVNLLISGNRQQRFITISVFYNRGHEFNVEINYVQNFLQKIDKYYSHVACS